MRLNLVRPSSSASRHAAAATASRVVCGCGDGTGYRDEGASWTPPSAWTAPQVPREIRLHEQEQAPLDYGRSQTTADECSGGVQLDENKPPGRSGNWAGHGKGDQLSTLLQAPWFDQPLATSQVVDKIFHARERHHT